MAQVITTKYNPASGKITAKCWCKTMRVEAYTTKAELGASHAHRNAADQLVKFLNANKDAGVMWEIIANSEGIAANEWVFIMECQTAPEARHEYRVSWEIDVLADSYERAARWVQDQYFAQGHAGYFEVKRAGDINPVVVDFQGE